MLSLAESTFTVTVFKICEKPFAGNGSCQGVFIRAPGIVSVDSSKAEVLATAPVNGEW